MNSLRGGGVESRHAAMRSRRDERMQQSMTGSRSSDRPAPPFPDHIEDVLEMVSSETGALPGARRCPDLSAATYASEQSAPDWRYFQNDYAALSRGF